MKTAFLFSGQGSQFIGMGQDLHGDAIVDSIYNKAAKLVGYCVKELTLNSSTEHLNKTENTQVAIVTMQSAILSLLKNKGIKSNATAGLSLGEYTALLNADVLSFDDLINVVSQRGKIMADVGSKLNQPKMIVALGLDSKETTTIVEEIKKTNSQIAVANYNCPGQQVIGGSKEAIEIFKEKASHAKRLIEIPVSVPSHTPLMEGSVEPFEKVLNSIEFKKPNQTFYSNVTGEANSNDELKNNLLKQLTNSTHMETIIRNMIKSGITRFIEIGPKKVLCGFVKKIAKELEVEVELIALTNKESIDSLSK